MVGEKIKVPPTKVQKVVQTQQPGLVERLEHLSVSGSYWKKRLYQAPPKVRRSTQLTQPHEYQFQTELRSQRRRVKQKESKNEPKQDYVGLKEFCQKFWTNNLNETTALGRKPPQTQSAAIQILQVEHRSDEKKVGFKAREVDQRIFDNKLWGMMGVPFKAVAASTKPQPFTFATQARSQIPRHQPDDKDEDAQHGLEQPKKIIHSQTDNFMLHCQKRAEKRRQFKNMLEQKRLQEQLNQQREAYEAKKQEQKLISEYRQKMEFKAAPMPDLSQPNFVPNYSCSQPPTVPIQPNLGQKRNRRRNDSHEYVELQDFVCMLES